MKVIQTIKETFSPSVIDVDHKKVRVGRGCEHVINAIGSCDFSTHYANILSGDRTMVRVTVDVLERDA